MHHDVTAAFTCREQIVVFQKRMIINVCLKFSYVLQKLFITLHETQRNRNMSKISNTDNTSNTSNIPKGDINRLKVVLVEQNFTNFLMTYFCDWFTGKRENILKNYNVLPKDSLVSKGGLETDLEHLCTEICHEQNS